MRDRASRTAPAFTALLLLAGLFAAPPLAAQKAGKDPGSPSKASKAPQISHEELESFADAYLAIAQVRKGMKMKLQNAGSKKERKGIQANANQKMASIIKDNDLTVRRYRQITKTLNSNKDQRQAFIKIVQAKRSGSGGGTSGGS